MMRRQTRWIVLSLALLAQVGPVLAQPADPLTVVAAENAALASRVASETAALEQEHAELARSRLAREQLEERLKRIARHAELGAAGREFAVMVRSELRTLPRAEQFAAANRRREQTLEQVSDTSVRTENAALALADLEAAVGRRLPAPPKGSDPTQGVQDEAALRERLAEQRDLLGRLQTRAQDRQQMLLDTAHAEADLVQRGVTARVELTRLLFWLPSPPERNLMVDLVPAIEWASSGARWQAAAAALVDEVKRTPAFAAVAVLMAAALLFGRAHLRRRLAVLAARAAHDVRARVCDALKATSVTLALALPVPLLMWAAGSLLATAVDAAPFTLALSVALEVTSRLLLALLVCVWLLDPRGLAAGHFGWDEVALRHAGGAMRRFTMFFVPLLLLAALNVLDHAPYANRETLGRLMFGAAMLVLAVFLVRLFRRASPLMQRLADRVPRGWAMRLYPAWYWALLAFPFGMLALVAEGYMTAAGFFFGRATYSLFLVIAAGVVYGLVALWVRVQHWTLERSRAAQVRLASQTMGANTSGGEAAVVHPEKIDLATMGEQTRALLDLTLTVLLLGGLWWVWKDALPALSTFGDWALWSFPADDKQPAFALTVSDLFLSIVITIVTWVAVRNVGAALDTLLLQRLEFQADANYAIKVMARYALTAVGVALACRTLGVSWSSVHWLIAALGVGLGFGLQEIVANFVSGLIVLAERPVRIGDVVTIGNVTGTVSRIRARATVVIDADNREVIIPNKGFITERVVNWTLSDTTTRLLLTFRVAYGSDVAAVQQRVLDAVRGTPDVVEVPAPSVFFVGLGETSLEFEVRAFVNSLDSMLRARHALNAAIERALTENHVKFPD